MEWVVSSPQIHSTFGNLGFMYKAQYYVNENCNAFLETILQNILTEDQHLRAYRRSINFGQNVQKDLVPLLINAKEDKTIELVVKILVNLSIPTECLIAIEQTSQSNFGLHVVFEINQLLRSIKAAFTGKRVTKVIADFLNKNVRFDQRKLSPEQCTNISNSLLLLRNILHIPEEVTRSNLGKGLLHPVQNRILWNIFSHSIDKILIVLMTIPEATNWTVPMVQLIALLYKDQHIATLPTLLNIWLETCCSDSSEDNESNTYPLDRGSCNSSPTLTSELSDMDGSGKCNDERNSEDNGLGAASKNNTMKDEIQPFVWPLPDINNVHTRENDASTGDVHVNLVNDKQVITETSETLYSSNDQQTTKFGKKAEPFDCGYGIRFKNHQALSTSSDDDGGAPSKIPVHRKPRKAKQRVNNKARSGITLQNRKRNMIFKRTNASIYNVQGLVLETPTDADVSNILTQFTVDFLLKGYKSLVQTLHSEILTNPRLEIDTSHFFWLVTYFLKYAVQIELGLELLSSVLSFDLVSYLTAQGIIIFEQFELAVKLDGNDLKPSSRRLHLVVTAIREQVQAIEAYQKFPNICTTDKDTLNLLQNKMCETDELRSLLMLLLRHYNPKYHSKLYLQDLIVTNHILLIFVDRAMRSPDYKGETKMIDHLRQFATPEMMYQYGLLLNDYAVNGEFINDCVFTVMHHVGGELDSLICLFQPHILRTFTSIWSSGYKVCDDWTDLIEYLINTFVKKPRVLLSSANIKQNPDTVEDDEFFIGLPAEIPTEKGENQLVLEMHKIMAPVGSSARQPSIERLTEMEPSSLSWKYLQYKTVTEEDGVILKRLKEYSSGEPKESLLNELFRQKIINRYELEKLPEEEANGETINSDSKFSQNNTEIRDVEIAKLCEQLKQDGKAKCFDWVQRVLLDTCYVKLHIENRHHDEFGTARDENNIHIFKKFLKQDIKDTPVMSPVSYHALLLNQSVPLVPWNCDQASICKDLRLLQLLHKLGFEMPVDTGKVFVRIPHVWSAAVLYEVAGRVASIDTTKLKFSLDDITISGTSTTRLQNDSMMSKDLTTDVNKLFGSDDYYQTNILQQLTVAVDFPPRTSSWSISSVQDEPHKRRWLEIVQQSQQLKLMGALRSASETDTVGSDLTQRYASDEDEKLELPVQRSVIK